MVNEQVLLSNATVGIETVKENTTTRALIYQDCKYLLIE